jgi:putative oxygen-independent coproporphyrinogen III oxidase
MAFGVYVHVPFCTRRCDYCAFATWTDRHHLMADYAAACRRQLEQLTVAADWPGPATSVFLGGGTPSLLPARLLVEILDAVPRGPGAEVTVECNPETVSGPLLASYRDAGVTRLSFGVQSLVPHVLAGLGRAHGVDDVPRAVMLAGESGFGGNYNVDLIHGATCESVVDWAATLNGVLALDPPPAHVSAYALTVEPGTPLAADSTRHPDDDDQADKYLHADTVLADAGLGWYELSNWARPGRECRHNQLYWAQGDYVGIGSAAHSHRAGHLWWNVRTPERFIRAMAEGRSPVAGEERLDAATRAIEALQLALRTRDGVPAAALAWSADLDGLVEWTDGRARLTRRGRLLANEVAARLVNVETAPLPAAV